MTKVYAISEGSYSDYRVRAIFKTRKLAEEAIARARTVSRYDDDWNEVEEYDLYDQVPQPITTYRLTQDLWDDGTEGPEYRTVSTAMPWDWDVAPRRPEVRFVRAPIHRDKGGRLEVAARTEAAARKAFRDRKARWRAEVEGIAT